MFFSKKLQYIIKKKFSLADPRFWLKLKGVSKKHAKTNSRSGPARLNAVMCANI